MTQTRKAVYAGCEFSFDVANLPPRSEWVGMKQGARLSGHPGAASLRRYCNPGEGLVVCREPMVRLVCPSFLFGQEIFTTPEAWNKWLKTRQLWRTKRREMLANLKQMEIK